MRAKDMRQPDDSGDLELRIQGMLQPVRPDEVFIEQLHRRLTTSPGVVMERRTSLVGLLLIAAGLLTGIISIVLIRRFWGESESENQTAQ